MKTVTTLLVLVALVAGCGDASGDRRDRSQPPVGYPFDGAAHLPADERALHTAAENVLIADCMRRRGFAYESRSGPRPARPDATNPYGLLSVAQARVHGYRIAEDLLARPGPDEDPNRRIRDALPPQRRAAWDAALLGTSEHEKEIRVDGGGVFTYRSDACAHVARRQLTGPDWDVLYLTVQAATNAVIDDVLRAPRVGRAQSAWATCMRQRGYRTAALADARRMVAERFAATRRVTDEALRLEQAVAVADAECQDRSRLWGAVGEAQRDVEGRATAGTRAAAERLRAARAEALAAARALLSPR